MVTVSFPYNILFLYTHCHDVPYVRGTLKSPLSSCATGRKALAVYKLIEYEHFGLNIKFTPF